LSCMYTDLCTAVVKLVQSRLEPPIAQYAGLHECRVLFLVELQPDYR